MRMIAAIVRRWSVDRASDLMRVATFADELGEPPEYGEVLTSFAELWGAFAGFCVPVTLLIAFLLLWSVGESASNHVWGPAGGVIFFALAFALLVWFRSWLFRRGVRRRYSRPTLLDVMLAAGAGIAVGLAWW
ncbi:MAG: hypothetical protein QOG53_3219 [Frankiales bacterium]|jgi:hypothetical protein|nr:hypothetical protein [Frankiales bacterium]